MRVHLPANEREALKLLQQSPGAVPVAGGTDLLVSWPVTPEAHERTYLDLSAIDAWKPLQWAEGELVLGPLTTYWDVIRDDRVRREFPLLVDAARQVGAVQIQARGTWAGNIANASPAADGVPVLMAYDAMVTLESAEGREAARLDALYRGYKDLRRRPDQLITAIRLPRRRYDFQVFEKVGGRRAQAIAKVGVAITRSAAGWRVVAASMAPTVRRCVTLERLLRDGTAVRSAVDLLDAIGRDVAPIDDLRSTADYRRTVMARVLYHHLREECGWP